MFLCLSCCLNELPVICETACMSVVRMGGGGWWCGQQQWRDAVKDVFHRSWAIVSMPWIYMFWFDFSLYAMFQNLNHATSDFVHCAFYMQATSDFMQFMHFHALLNFGYISSWYLVYTVGIYFYTLLTHNSIHCWSSCYVVFMW